MKGRFPCAVVVELGDEVEVEPRPSTVGPVVPVGPPVVVVVEPSSWNVVDGPGPMVVDDVGLLVEVVDDGRVLVVLSVDDGEDEDVDAGAVLDDVSGTDVEVDDVDGAVLDEVSGTVLVVDSVTDVEVEAVAEVDDSGTEVDVVDDSGTVLVVLSVDGGDEVVDPGAVVVVDPEWQYFRVWVVFAEPCGLPLYDQWSLAVTVFEPEPSAIVIVSVVPGPWNVMSRVAVSTPLITTDSCAVAVTFGKS